MTFFKNCTNIESPMLTHLLRHTVGPMMLTNNCNNNKSSMLDTFISSSWVPISHTHINYMVNCKLVCKQHTMDNWWHIEFMVLNSKERKENCLILLYDHTHKMCNKALCSSVLMHRSIDSLYSIVYYRSTLYKLNISKVFFLSVFFLLLKITYL